MFTIPADRLPEGFAERIERPPAEPAVPRPAATVVLLRDGASGPELLLMRRHRSSGFVPGAFVFPGGRVDAADADPLLAGRVDGLDAGPDPDPELAYWLAGVREVFEETGVLLARDAYGRRVADAGSDPAVAHWREALLADRTTLREALEALEARVALDGVVYCAHWITPVAESRRYDTRFFLARVPDGCEVRIDEREMTEALWLAPAMALERFRAGRLPMVFPTVATIESLAPHRSVDEALAAFRRVVIEPVLPRLVRTEGGVGIVIDG